MQTCKMSQPKPKAVFFRIVEVKELVTRETYKLKIEFNSQADVLSKRDHKQIKKCWENINP